MAKAVQHHPANRKRHGHHQKRSGHFLKVYQPFLPLFLLGVITASLVGLSFRNRSISMGVAKTPKTTESTVLAYATNIGNSGLLGATNQRRAAAGLGNLSINGQLNQAAQAKANDMAGRNYWAHNTPEGTPPWAFITNAGYSYNRAGENLACGFNESTEVITGWYNSPSHRENLLHTEYKEVGFGIANSANYNCGDFPAGQQTIVVAMYADPYTAPAPAPPAATPATPTTPTRSTNGASQQSGGGPVAEQVDTRHKVTLTITNADGKPSNNIKVTLHSNPQVGYTDESGNVIFSDVETGIHKVIVEIKGAQAETEIDLTDAPKDYKLSIQEPVLTSNQVSRDGKASTSAAQPKQVNRIDILVSRNPQLLLGVLVFLTAMGIGYMLTKHSVAAHRFFTKGEKYILKHKFVDMLVLGLLVLLYVLTRNVGAIL